MQPSVKEEWMVLISGFLSARTVPSTVSALNPRRLLSRRSHDCWRGGDGSRGEATPLPLPQLPVPQPVHQSAWLPFSLSFYFLSQNLAFFPFSPLGLFLCWPLAILPQAPVPPAFLICVHSFWSQPFSASFSSLISKCLSVSFIGLPCHHHPIRQQKKVRTVWVKKEGSESQLQRITTLIIQGQS